MILKPFQTVFTSLLYCFYALEQCYVPIIAYVNADVKLMLCDVKFRRTLADLRVSLKDLFFDRLHLEVHCMARPKMVTSLNARNPTAARGACYECDGTDHYKSAGTRLNRAPRQEGKSSSMIICFLMLTPKCYDDQSSVTPRVPRIDRVSDRLVYSQ
ncbi:hypothetical protein Tco_1132821 [Tanacetum coccineum]|uniref:Uncharacterized protein n=1 Tax=Tanacetum coccineum TaxID=301880 RepID=A0ABQ5JD17_9ASTR